MKVFVATGLLATAALISAPPVQAQSIMDGPVMDQSAEPLMVDDVRTFSFPKAIGRVELSRDNVVAVSAPTDRSLRIKKVGEGETTLSVYSADGALMRQAVLQVGPSQQMSGGQTEGLQGSLRPGQKIVAVDVQFAAVSASTLKALGFNFTRFSGGLQGAVISPSSLNSYALGSSGLSIDASAPIQSAFNLFLAGPNRGIGGVLSALSSSGLSQLLAQPTLLVRSGESANFLAGGEVPIPVPQSSGGGNNTIAIQYKEFGVRLAVTPWVLNKDHIVLKLAPEVSELDYSNGVQLQGYVVPGIRRRSAETVVELGSGQSFVIAGLNYSNSSISKSKVPFLGDIPVLGAFFKRQQNQKERQELIIVATPRLVEPGAVPDVSMAGQPLDPSFGQMVVGNDGVEKAVQDFGLVRR